MKQKLVLIGKTTIPLFEKERSGSPFRVFRNRITNQWKMYKGTTDNLVAIGVRSSSDNTLYIFADKEEVPWLEKEMIKTL